MERQLSKSERKNMDTCLRRLKQELVSMKEAGDGLHAQMNSMMGALQELKLLQVQTALERLDVSGRPIQKAAAPPPSVETCPVPSPDFTLSPTNDEMPSPKLGAHRSSLGTSPSSSSLETMDSESQHLPRRVSGYTAPQVEYCGPRLSQAYPEHQQYHQPTHPAQVVDLPGILYSLSREGPSLDSDYSQDSADDASDWTSSLMSQSRNRQPLVLGDNVFADLVGNWLDLPELEKEELAVSAGARGADRPDSPAHPLRLSRSQEICRKFSLTTNIFKKFLRSVRPDRDKLLKERPGWMVPDTQEAELFKRPRKAAQQQTKGSFYLPFWAGVGQQQQGKGRPCPQTVEEVPSQGLVSRLYIDRRQDWREEARMEKLQPLFDYNTAVWV
ncbi:hypothetical protein UPYG_G00174710 [Umbra pygmaea]|uniref:PAK4-inhibitor INKA2 n=1 Tax=Umbra pygmaea TaxID=75934 RepID=A0ABD0WPI6_UMBPY